MNRLLAGAVMLLAGCGDITSPVCDTLSAQTRSADALNNQQNLNVVDVATEAELHAGLRAGFNAFRRTMAITLSVPLLLDTFPIGSFFSWDGPPAYGAHTVRGFDGPEPLLRFDTTRDWRINIGAGAWEVPLVFRNAGPSIVVRRMFASTWRDAMFEYHPHKPFVVEGGSAITFDNLQLQSNGESALLTNMADLNFFGGYIEDHRYNAPNHGTGLDAYAADGVKSPLIWIGVHQEFSKINLHGFTSADLSPGYCLVCQLNLINVGCVA